MCAYCNTSFPPFKVCFCSNRCVASCAVNRKRDKFTWIVTLLKTKMSLISILCLMHLQIEFWIWYLRSISTHMNKLLSCDLNGNVIYQCRNVNWLTCARTSEGKVTCKHISAVSTPRGFEHLTSSDPLSRLAICRQCCMPVVYIFTNLMLFFPRIIVRTYINLCNTIVSSQWKMWSTFLMPRNDIRFQGALLEWFFGCSGIFCVFTARRHANLVNRSSHR